MPADDLSPPLRQDQLWTLLGLVVLAIAGAWLVWVMWTTRRPRQPVGATGPVAGRALDDLRRTYLHHIDGGEAAHADGRLDARDACQALSPLIRRFAFEASGFPAHTKSLADLEREHPGALPAVVAVLYPDEFAERSTGDVHVSVDRARQLISGWS